MSKYCGAEKVSLSTPKKESFIFKILKSSVSYEWKRITSSGTTWQCDKEKWMQAMGLFSESLKLIVFNGSTISCNITMSKSI